MPNWSPRLVSGERLGGYGRPLSNAYHGTGASVSSKTKDNFRLDALASLASIFSSRGSGVWVGKVVLVAYLENRALGHAGIVLLLATPRPYPSDMGIAAALPAPPCILRTYTMVCGLLLGLPCLS